LGDLSSVATFIVITLAAAWFAQYVMAFFQLKRFYKRVYQLRRYGSVWVGKYGSAWKGRTFAVLVVNKERRITKVESFAGITILANLKPVEGLEGRHIADIKDDSIELPVSRRMLLALRNAVSFIDLADEQSAARAKEQENSTSANGILDENPVGEEANRRLSLES
jgi:DNA-binding transcriptional regulator of glucitol operon